MVPRDLGGEWGAASVIPTLREPVEDPKNPAYCAAKGDDEAYYGEPPMHADVIARAERLKKLTMQERINMRIDYGTDWARHIHP